MPLEFLSGNFCQVSFKITIKLLLFINSIPVWNRGENHGVGAVEVTGIFCCCYYCCCCYYYFIVVVMTIIIIIIVKKKKEFGCHFGQRLQRRANNWLQISSINCLRLEDIVFEQKSYIGKSFFFLIHFLFDTIIIKLVHSNNVRVVII